MAIARAYKGTGLISDPANWVDIMVSAAVGPTGATGPTGPAGADGADGADGEGSMSAAEILAALLTVDGLGSGLVAESLDTGEGFWTAADWTTYTQDIADSRISSHIAASDPHGDRAYADSLGGGGGGTLAIATYLPGSDTQFGVSPTATMTAISGSGWAPSVTFTVPASGAVEVLLQAVVEDCVGTAYHWGIKDGATTVADATTALNTLSGEGLQFSITLYVNGLTPGASKTWTWAHAQVPASANPKAFAGPTYGRAIMRVNASI